MRVPTLQVNFVKDLIYSSCNSRLKHGDTSNYTGTSQASTCSMTGGEMSASCCSSMTHSPCSNNCSLQADRPKYLNLKPIYVRDVSREQGSVFKEHANIVPRSSLFNDESSSPHDDINYHLSRIMKNQFKTFHPEKRYQTNDYPDPDLSNDESSEEDEFSEGRQSNSRIILGLFRNLSNFRSTEHQKTPFKV